MTASNAYDMASTLSTKVTSLLTALSGASATHVDEHTDHSWYSVPEAIIDDIKEATDLVIGCINKVHSITGESLV